MGLAIESGEHKTPELEELEKLLEGFDARTAKEAFDTLCEAGCDANQLALRLMRVKWASEGHITIPRDNKDRPIVFPYDGLDSWETALDGLELKDLDRIARLAKTLQNSLLGLTSTLLVRTLIARGEITDSDLLSRSYFLSKRKLPDPRFDGVINLPKIARGLGPRKKVRLRRSLVELVAYVRTATSKPRFVCIGQITSLLIGLDVDALKSAISRQKVTRKPT